ncbi:MAG TPA: hypothetical protein VH914_13010 [Acidimicrobiia bacterium]|jgi:hypothetical protein|nr:hypothetical protein [Acidimicrobiia bacterium]
MASDPADDARLLSWLALRERGASDAVVGWATQGLSRVCPIVTSLLAFDQRLEREVDAELERPTAARSVEEWGFAFAQRLTTDADPWISWAAQVDAGTLEVEESRRRVDPSCPGDPVQAILLITSGADPR